MSVTHFTFPAIILKQNQPVSKKRFRDAKLKTEENTNQASQRGREVASRKDFNITEIEKVNYFKNQGKRIY